MRIERNPTIAILQVSNAYHKFFNILSVECFGATVFGSLVSREIDFKGYGFGMGQLIYLFRKPNITQIQID